MSGNHLGSRSYRFTERRLGGRLYAGRNYESSTPGATGGRLL